MMRYVTIAAVGTLGALLAVSGIATAAQETLIYTGDVKTAPVPLALGSWGSGSLQEVTDVRYQGASALKLVSHGDFQGGRIDFATPIDISGYAGQPNAYIEMWLRPHFARPKPKAAAGTESAVGGADRVPGGSAEERGGQLRLSLSGLRMGGGRDRTSSRTTVAPARRPSQPTRTGARVAPRTTRRTSTGLGGVGLGGRRDSRTSRVLPSSRASAGRLGTVMRRTPGATRTTYRRTQPTPQAKPAPAPIPTGPAPAAEAAFQTDGFRVQLTTDKGTAVLADYPIHPGDRNASGWTRVGFPLSEFKGPLGDQLERIAVFSERPDIFYVGEMKITLDTSPLGAKPVAYPAIARTGQPVTFLADAKGGLAPVQAVWDFDNSDGVETQATGTRVTNVYDQPGDYEATVIVSDATGANPESKTYVVLVRVR
ncbi:MAG: PKD domain-containing protein [Armatimonadota bacterium]|nr:MAG: PKD domain-containing protein [Armatimonadota bacterium]